MITIICTKEEKEKILEVLDFSESCLFEKNTDVICKTEEDTCHLCYNEHIKWIITEEE